MARIVTVAALQPALTSVEAETSPRLAHDFTRHGDHPFKTEMLGDRRPDAYGVITEKALAAQHPVAANR